MLLNPFYRSSKIGFASWKALAQNLVTYVGRPTCASVWVCAQRDSSGRASTTLYVHRVDKSLKVRRAGNRVCECCRSRNGCFTASLVVVHINLRASQQPPRVKEERIRAIKIYASSPGRISSRCVLAADLVNKKRNKRENARRAIKMFCGADGGGGRSDLCTSLIAFGLVEAHSHTC